jgi:hypothetical protein
MSPEEFDKLWDETPKIKEKKHRLNNKKSI